MSRPVRRSTRSRLLWAKTHTATDWLEALRQHGCHEPTPPRVMMASLTVATAWGLPRQVLWDSLDEIAARHGVCPVCVLRELLSNENLGPPLWFGRLVAHWYGLDASSGRDYAEFVDHLLWAACRAARAQTSLEANQFLSMAGKPEVRA